MRSLYLLAVILVTCLVTWTFTVTAYDVTDDDSLQASRTLSRRPESFKDINELNEYLSEMKQYYNLLGRPRYGRSLDHMTRHRQPNLAPPHSEEGANERVKGNHQSPKLNKGSLLG